VRWALLDFQATADAGTDILGELAFSGGEAAGYGDHRSLAVESAAEVLVDTGVLRVVLAAGPDSPIADLQCSTGPVLDAARSGLRVLDRKGRPCQVQWGLPRVEENGPLRSVARADGKVIGRGFSLDLGARFHFFAGSAAVRLELAIRNPRRARHPGGIWELGDPGSVLLREVALDLVRPESSPADRIEWSVEAASPWNVSRERVEVYQESSGGENWCSRNQVNRHGVVPLRFRGYELTADGATASGHRATPVVVTRGGSITLGATVRHFWENFPKGLLGGPYGVTVGLFPGRAADLHEIQGGEQKTHECCLLFGPDPVTASPLEWCRSPLLAHLSSEWYAESGAVTWLTPAASDPHADYLALVSGAIEGDESFVVKRERADEYGWRHFGEIHADHEAVYAPNPAVFVSHYNNQYDAIDGFAVHFLRTGDARWWRQMDELARHVVDIDIYHTGEDKAAYSHGLFWHTAHYIDGGRATHRGQPGAPGVPGGGPANEHDYTTGLMRHYFLTGAEASRAAVLELASWVLDMDDGRKSVFRWLDRGDTGLASATGAESYHGPGRGAANSILTLLNAHVLAGDPRYLEKADQLVRRCIHPAEDITALDLLDAERRWSYTVFLQALGRYLQHKAERGTLDSMDCYARASLLHFARWMADHEYPYLEKPEILEYPNETWAAQDMRKCEVFDLAFVYAAAGERERFKERAEFFFRYSTRTLSGMATHTLARPRVLMLSYGWAHAFFCQHHEADRLEVPSDSAAWGQPLRFVPQKARAVKRAKVLLVSIATVFLVAAAAAILAWLAEWFR
jgi:hypothetical protein